MNNPNKKRLRRTMMFLNAQKPGLIKDPYIYKADSLMLDLEDAVAENQKDVARFSLYHALKTVDYRGAEPVSYTHLPLSEAGEILHHRHFQIRTGRCGGLPPGCGAYQTHASDDHADEGCGRGVFEALIN